MTSALELRVDPARGEWVLAGMIVPIAPAGKRGELRVGGECGPVLRPLRFGERTRLAEFAARCADPRASLGAVLSRAATVSEGELDARVHEAAALILCGAGQAGPSFGMTALAVARAAGYDIEAVTEAEAAVVDRIAAAAGAMPREAGWRRLLFGAAEPTDALSILRDELADALLARVDEGEAAAADSHRNEWERSALLRAPPRDGSDEARDMGRAEFDLGLAQDARAGDPTPGSREPRARMPGSNKGALASGAEIPGHASLAGTAHAAHAWSAHVQSDPRVRPEAYVQGNARPPRDTRVQSNAQLQRDAGERNATPLEIAHLQDTSAHAQANGFGAWSALNGARPASGIPRLSAARLASPPDEAAVAPWLRAQPPDASAAAPLDPFGVRAAMSSATLRSMPSARAGSEALDLHALSSALAEDLADALARLLAEEADLRGIA